MEKHDTCILSIGSVTDGKHHVCLNLDESYFSSHPIAEADSVKVTVNLYLDRVDSQINGLIELEGSGMMECDICLEPCSVVFENDADFVIEIGGNKDVRGSLDNIYRVEADAETCDITDLVLDSIVLGLPMKRNHGLDESGNYLCTSEVAKLVGKYIVRNKENTDSRWDGLTNIKFN